MDSRAANWDAERLRLREVAREAEARALELGREAESLRQRGDKESAVLAAAMSNAVGEVQTMESHLRQKEAQVKYMTLYQ